MWAGEEERRAALLGPAVVSRGGDAVAVAHGFARDHLVAADDAFAAPEIDDHIAVLDPLDRAVDDFADAILELVELAVALGFTNLLDDHLLGGLCGDAAEIHRRQRIGDEVAELGVGVAVSRKFQRNLRDVVLGLLDTLQQALPATFAGLGIAVGADVGFRTIAGARRLLDGEIGRAHV